MRSYSYGCSCHFVFLLRFAVIFWEAKISFANRLTCVVSRVGLLRKAEVEASVLITPGWKLREEIKDFWTIPVTLRGASTVYHSRPARLVAIGHANGPHHYFRFSGSGLMSHWWIGGLLGAWCLLLRAFCEHLAEATN
jgi:hypothetical protein